MHDDGSTRIGKQLTAKPDQTPAGHFELNSHPPIAVIMHIDDFRFARAKLLHDDAYEVFWNVHGKTFNGLHQSPIHAFSDDFWFADHQLIAFPAHHLDEAGKLQFTASHHYESVGTIGVFHA